MTNKKEKAQEWEKVNPEECTHVGFYVPIGMKAFQVGSKKDLYEIIIAKLCLRCGKEFTSKTSLLSMTFVETIKTPKIPVRYQNVDMQIEEHGVNMHDPLVKSLSKVYEQMPKKIAKKKAGRPRLFKNAKKKKFIPRFP